LVDEYDPAEKKLKEEEDKREAEDKLSDILKSIKGGKEVAKAGEEIKKGGVLESLSNLFSGGIGGAVEQIIASLAGMATTVASGLAAIALPALGVMAAAAGGAAIGYSLYKTWIEPAMDRAQSERNAVLAQKTETTKQAITTDTGEAVYAVDMMGKNTVMTEAEIKGKIATASPEEKAKLQKALSAGPMQQIVDTSTGIRTDAFGRFKSGESIEQFRKREEEDTEARRKDPSGYKFNVLKNSIATFDDKARNQWMQMKKSGASYDALEMKMKLIQNEAEILYNSVTKGGASNLLTEDQKEKLLDMSNIVTDMGRGQMLETGDVDNIMGVGTAFKMFQGEQSEKVKQIIQELKENSKTNGTIVPPSTPSTDVGRTTMQLDNARDAAEQAKQTGSASAPTVNAVNAPKTTNNAITVNNNTGAGVRNNDPTLKSAERASL
jgi:hypothetical protein